MSPRKPPQIADWLLLFFGFYRKDSPLAGDLLEEFESGRSAAWFWRQTLVLLLTGMFRNARAARPRLLGSLLGWAVQAAAAFILWWFQFPPRLPHGRSVGPLVAMSSALEMMIVTIGLAILCHSVNRELKRRSLVPEGVMMSACNQFGNSLTVYCMMAMVGMPMREGFIFVQVTLFAYWIIGVAMPSVLFGKGKKA